MASGYGLTTHFYHLVNGLAPEDADVLCTIPDYIAMCFAGEKRSVGSGSLINIIISNDGGACDGPLVYFCRIWYNPDIMIYSNGIFEKFYIKIRCLS